jgi:hypothetical protein
MSKSKLTKYYATYGGRCTTVAAIGERAAHQAAMEALRVPERRAAKLTVVEVTWARYLPRA